MTKKDYELIANVLAGCNDPKSLVSTTSLEIIAVEMADALAMTNPLFDRKRFLKACGVENM